MYDINSQNEVTDEFGVVLVVDKNSKSPKKTRTYYNKHLRLNRAVIATVLAVYKESGFSDNSLRCLDGIGSTGINGILWAKYLGPRVAVTINDPFKSACARITENVERNDVNVYISHKDTCLLLHERSFDFISLDCRTDASLYFDSAFRNLATNGILAVTTTDDSSLYGATPELALRNYGAVITRTFYNKELAIRVVVAALARTAARYSKGLKVLCCFSYMSSFTVIVTVSKGAINVNETLKNITNIIHCKMCEDRVFKPVTEFFIESPSRLLSCDCSVKYPGKVAMELGPVWSGEIFDVEFLEKMMVELKHFPWDTSLRPYLQSMLKEARCENIRPSKETDTDESASKKPRLEDNNAPAPAFYFNLPKHMPKGPNLLPINKVVECLRGTGYRASRSHFSKEAIRTSANLKQFTEVLSMHSKS